MPSDWRARARHARRSTSCWVLPRPMRALLVIVTTVSPPPVGSRVQRLLTLPQELRQPVDVVAEAELRIALRDAFDQGVPSDLHPARRPDHPAVRAAGEDAGVIDLVDPGAQGAEVGEHAPDLRRRCRDDAAAVDIGHGHTLRESDDAVGRSRAESRKVDAISRIFVQLSDARRTETAGQLGLDNVVLPPVASGTVLTLRNLESVLQTGRLVTPVRECRASGS